MDGAAAVLSKALDGKFGEIVPTILLRRELVGGGRDLVRCSISARTDAV
ncbi:hypothetical protein [Phyllobacterium sp. P30BS-XVII]|nr:hypothetical protein [Phyllobacterium sp. P30BS-XVII]MBA8903876.1 hypothetical protein [Phyllobacterium sp. P30BS-XVII]